MAIKAPFNLFQWIEDNRDLLKPPVGNKNLYVESGDYIVMIFTKQRPFYLIEIHDVPMAQNMRHLFSGLWKMV